MRASRLIIRLIGFLFGFLFASAIVTTPAYMRSEFRFAAATLNAPPVASSDNYTRHGGGTIGPLLANDSDPDGDPMHVQIETFPTQGRLLGLDGNSFTYALTNQSFIGTDSFTYKACDTSNACSGVTPVTVNVVNQPPVAGADSYTVRGGTIIGPLFANDFDPEQDSFTGPFLTVAASHGTVFGLPNPQPTDMKLYVPHAGYAGIDSWEYQITDLFGLSATATVTLFVLDSDAEDAGPCTKCPTGGAGGAIAVGGPVNVTNGNMYLQQSDYQLPGVGSELNITRTYNSKLLATTGLFGLGWSTAYDESIKVHDPIFIRLNLPDGRAVYFTRPNSSSAFASVEKDFHDQVTQNGDGSFTLSFLDGRVHQFNAGGKLLSLTDRYNNQTTLTYDTGGKLVSVSDPFGRVLSFTTNANGQTLSISDTMGMIGTYTYGSSNQLLSVTYADNSAFQFSYDGSFRLTSVSDALGNVLESHTYDSQGRALTSERQGGIERYTLNYVSDTQTDVTDALGHLTKYTVDKSKGRDVVTKVEGNCSCGNSQIRTWIYDSQSNVTGMTDALNHVTSYTYDGNGNRLTETDVTGTVSFTYNQFSEVLTRTDQLSGVTTNTYDATGKLLTTGDALNNTATFTYNARGQVLTATDARGKVTTFTYDAAGNLTQSKDANNIITFYFYDARSRLTKIRDGLSRSTLYAYDLAGRLNKVTHPDLSFLSFAYDLAGRRTTVTDERGNPTNYAYDSAYRLTTVTDAFTHSASYGYDAMSNLTSMTDALSGVTNYEYDDFNRLVKITYPPATTGATRLFETSAYDASGNVVQRTDTAGRTTFFGYESAGRLDNTTDPDNKTTLFDYDPLGRVTIVTDALNQQYEFAYDAVGRQTGITRGGVSMNYVYDAVGNRTQRTDYNGAVTNYAYDNLNRLTTITYPTRTATYSYMVTGQLSRATNENGSVYIGYDNRYRVSSFSDPFNYGISYNYDKAGNRTKLSLNYATYATYTYDAVNRLTNLADSANQNFPHSYDAVNRLTARSAPNGVTSNDAYDGLSRPTSLTHVAGATTLIGNQYTYNEANNITNWTSASGNHAYSYDLVDRLTSATNSAQPNENYAYDGVGNRITSHLSASHGYQPFNRLTSTATAIYTYDNNGNLISSTNSLGTTTFTWNEENQLTQVALPAGLTVSYKYDGLGRRIQRTTSAGANERYVYDGNDVLLDLNADWSVATTYLNGLSIDDHLRQTSATTGVSYYLTDHLGTTAASTDSAGNVVEQLAYDSFGNSSGSLLTRYGYAGRERDSDTGLMYYRARWYDPHVGRFISEDPIGFDGGDVNLYAYVLNNPANFRDPTGRQRADRDRPGDIEWARGLKKAIDRMPTAPRQRSSCCNKTWTDCYVQCVENHRLDSLLPVLGSRLPKRILPPFRVVTSRQTGTTIASTVSHYLPESLPRAATILRGGGRIVSRVATPALIFEGFYDWGILGSCAELCHRNPCN